MYKTRKLISVLCAICMILSLSAPAFAAVEPPTLEKYAYMDLDSASDDLQFAILAARKNLIYGEQAWSASGNASIIRADGTVEAVPKFSDVFPGWDLYQISTLDINVANSALASVGLEEYALSEASAATVNSVQRRAPGYNGNVLLTAAVTGQDAPTFYRFNSSGETVRTKAATLPTGCEDYNIGYSDEDTGASIDWFPYLKLGDEVAECDTTSGVRYGVRASTYSVTGYARMVVEVV